MNRWKNDFSNLLNPINDTTDTDRPVIVPNNNLNHAMLNDVELNGNITYEELGKVIKMQVITKHLVMMTSRQKF